MAGRELQASRGWQSRARVRARWVVLATGAASAALTAAGMCERRTPSGIALRGYVKNDAMVARITRLEVVWHRALRRGYGWIFPCGGGVFNIGVGVAQRRARRGGRTRCGTSTCARCSPPSRACTRRRASSSMAGAGRPRRTELKGAPLRCSLDRRALAAPGLLVTGEAAGSTYAFTGEGIGKAMETGMLAAEAIGARDERLDDAAVRADYEAARPALKPRFDAVRAGQPHQRRIRGWPTC